MTAASAAPTGTAPASPRPAVDPRTRQLLQAPIVPLLLGMAWPNVLIMVAQASTGLIETWWIARLGTDALAGMALVFPAVMLMQMISGGAMGGGISSAVARALGAGRRDEADTLVLHALLINAVLGLGFSAIFLVFGEPIYRLLGGDGAALQAALSYSNIVFAGNVLLWIMNALASVLRGTGNMLVPALVTCIGVVLLIPLSPLLIFGYGPLPALGIAGGGVALVIFYAGGVAALAWYVLSGRSTIRLRRVPLRWLSSQGILRVGAISSLNSIQTNLVIAGATALVAASAGVAGVAGFGTGARIEYLLIPLVFGVGAPLVALVGANVGAGHQARALRIALTGGALAFAATETIGVAVAIWPQHWLLLFSDDPGMVAAGSAYLRIVGPCFGFFGLGMALYFASQGAGRLFWPLAAGVLRLAIGLGGGWLALRLGAPIQALFVALGIALVAFGMTLFVAVRSGAWFR